MIPRPFMPVTLMNCENILVNWPFSGAVWVTRYCGANTRDSESVYLTASKKETLGSA